MRPCVLNGIGGLAEEPDFLNRVIHLDLPSIPDDCRRTEREYWQAFRAARPAIFAGLLDALSRSLAVEPGLKVKLEARMADFYKWGCAVEVALGWPKGSFRTAYSANHEMVMEDSLGENHLAQAVVEVVRSKLKVGASLEASPTEVLTAISKGSATPSGGAHVCGRRTPMRWASG